MAYYDVSSGQVSSGVVVGSWETMYVYSGGVANSTTVNSVGDLYV